MPGEVMEAFVRILGQAEAGEKPSRLFLGAASAGLRCFLEIHFAIGGVLIGKLAWHTLAVKKTGDLTRIIGLRKGEPRKLEPGRRLDCRDGFADLLPAPAQFGAGFRVAARLEHATAERGIEGFHRVNDWESAFMDGGGWS